MSLTLSVRDPIADLLTRIRNANSIKQATCDVPASKMKKALLKVLKDEGYIADFTSFEATTRAKAKVEMLRVKLKYGPRGERILNRIQLVSKQGRREYRKVKTLDKVMDGLGIGVVTTSHGVMSDREARKLKVGGELIARVW